MNPKSAKKLDNGYIFIPWSTKDGENVFPSIGDDAIKFNRDYLDKYIFGDSLYKSLFANDRLFIDYNTRNKFIMDGNMIKHFKGFSTIPKKCFDFDFSIQVDLKNIICRVINADSEGITVTTQGYPAKEILEAALNKDYLHVSVFSTFIGDTTNKPTPEKLHWVGFVIDITNLEEKNRVEQGEED